MGKKRIRPTAICILRRGDELLVHEGDEPFQAVWRSRSALRDGPHFLVPPQLWDFL